MPRLTLQLFGPVRLLDASSGPVFIKSVKARALLALLANCREMRAQRAWVIEMLWSRGKGQESLRQELRKLRQIAGPDLFVGGTGWIGLNPEFISVGSCPTEAGQIGEVYAEDLDLVREPEFEDWLRDIRCVSPAPKLPATVDNSEPAPIFQSLAGPGRRPCLILGRCETAEEKQKLHADLLLLVAANRAAPLVNAEVVNHAEVGIAPPFSLELSCRASGGFGRIILQPQIRLPESGTVLWSQIFSATDNLLSDMIADAVAALAVAIVAESDTIRRIAKAAHNPSAPKLPCFSDIFSFNRWALLRADSELEAPPNDVPAASALALRAMIRHTLLLERFSDNPEATLSEAIEFALRARELAPHDPMVLAMAAITYGLAGQDEFALETATLAKTADPSHAFARQALSVALSFTGRFSDAHEEAIAARSNRMAMLAPALFYIRNAKTAIGIGDRPTALRWARLSVQTSPEFRAGHRTVAALSYSLGLEDVAEESLKSLKLLEPDFSLDRMECPEYPVETLRSAGLMAVTRSGLV